MVTLQSATGGTPERAQNSNSSPDRCISSCSALVGYQWVRYGYVDSGVHYGVYCVCDAMGRHRYYFITKELSTSAASGRVGFYRSPLDRND